MMNSTVTEYTDVIETREGPLRADPTILAESRLGTELLPEECDALVAEMEVLPLVDGQVLCHEGERDSALYVLASGKIEVVNLVSGQEEVVYRMQVGETAGTRVFIDRGRRRSTLRAVGETTVYALQPARFEALIKRQPFMVYKVMRAMLKITHANLMRMNRESEALSNYVTHRGLYTRY
jgi:CRP-like cAMP-binding protein